MIGVCVKMRIGSRYWGDVGGDEIPSFSHRHFGTIYFGCADSLRIPGQKCILRLCSVVGPIDSFLGGLTLIGVPEVNITILQ